MSKRYIYDEHKWRDMSLRVLIILVSTIIIVMAMPRSNTPKFDQKANTPWTQAPVTASFTFDIPKDAAILQAERDSVAREFMPYYTLNPNVAATQKKRFVAKNYNGIEGLPKSFLTVVSNRLDDIYRIGIMEQESFSSISRDSLTTIRIINGKITQSKLMKNLLTPLKAYEFFFADPQIANVRAQLQKCNINEYLVPNVTYDSVKNSIELEERLDRIASFSGRIQEGQRIIDRGDMVTKESARVLTAYYNEMEKNLSTKSKISTMIGRILFIFILLSIFMGYMHLFRGDYFDKPRTMSMVFAFIVTFPVIISLIVQYNFFSVYVIPIAMVPMFVRVFLDSRTAFMAHITMILICSLVLSRPYEYLLIQINSGLVAIYILRELSKRSQIFTAALGTTLMAIATHYATQLMQPGEDTVLSHSMLMHFIFSGIFLLLAYPLMFLVEKAFGFTSAVTLFELSDTNKDLLRKLSDVAPGTFQHSITVGNIAAEIAQKIGARSLLVRTGALYHDIGKMSNPAFFTENQAGSNPHDHMTPQESAQIIIGHISEGIRLADKHGLPEVIRDFILTHHGMGMAKYFYITYKNQHPDEEVDTTPFSYPGPNPFTREQAILMMADAVEAASRSLTEYTDETITTLVNRIIDGQVSEGYFRECPITFRDIAIAKNVLIYKLKTIYHTRITYPELKK